MTPLLYSDHVVFSGVEAQHQKQAQSQRCDVVTTYNQLSLTSWIRILEGLVYRTHEA
jgi:hypothetical protein